MTSSIQRHAAITLAALLAVFVFTATSVTSAADQELPTAEEILDRYIAATGGQEAYDKTKNRVVKGEMELAGQGIKLSLTVYSAKPNLVYTVIESDVTGKIEGGTNGNVVWENSLIAGPSIKKNAERSNGLRDAVFDRFVYWKTVYAKAECVGKKEINTSLCFKIVLTPKPTQPASTDQQPSEPVSLYIDENSSLVTKVETKVVTAAGTIPVEAFFSDYKKVDGLLVSHKLVMKLLTQERIQRMTSIKHNVELAKDRFELPDVVQSLVDKE